MWFFSLTLMQISGGWRHTMALTSNGKLYGWGWNKVTKTLLCVLAYKLWAKIKH